MLPTTLRCCPINKLARFCPANRIGTFSFSLDFRLVHLFWDISEIGSVDIASLRIVLVGPVAHHLVTASSKPSGGNYFRLPMFYPVNKNASDKFIRSRRKSITCTHYHSFTVGFLVSWPRTKCRVTFDSCL